MKKNMATLKFNVVAQGKATIFFDDFSFGMTDAVVEGENKLVIEVATTLERQTYPMLSGYRKLLAVKPESGTGLTGTVKLITR